MAEYYRNEIELINKKISSLNAELLSAPTKDERLFILDELEVAYCELADALADLRKELA